MIIAPIRIGISCVVTNADAVAPALPRVDMIVNPSGPQLHAPETTPKIEPNMPPPILRFCVLSMRTLKTFIGMTSADNVQSIRIKTRPNSEPPGTCPTTYGFKKTYPDASNKPSNMAEKITVANKIYQRFEKTSLIVRVTLHHRIDDLHEC